MIPENIEKNMYSDSRFLFRENKTGKTSNSNLAKKKPNEKKTENANFRTDPLSLIKRSSFDLKIANRGVIYPQGSKKMSFYFRICFNGTKI